MAIRNVPAGNGLTWITEAIQLLLKNPAPFVLMGLVMAVAGIIPILGSLALAILGPALYGGIAWAARAQARGETARFEQIGQAFQQEGKIGPMLLLCLPGVVGGMLAGILVVIMVAIMMAGAGISAAADSTAALWASLGVGGIFVLLVVVALALVVFALTFFAIPDVMFARNDAFAAIKQSLRASLANVGALLLYAVVLGLAMLVLVVVLSMLSPILAQFLVSIALAPVFGASMYLAWKDVYGETAAELAPPQADSPDAGGIVA